MVSVKAPDSLAAERKSVVVGLATRLLEPLAEDEPPTWVVAAVVEMVWSAASAACSASDLREVWSCWRMARGATSSAKAWVSVSGMSSGELGVAASRPWPV